MSDEELDDLERMSNAATPGPWAWETAEGDGVTLKYPERVPPGCVVMCELVNADRWIITSEAVTAVTGLKPDENDGETDGAFDVFNVHIPDAEFIVASRTAVPALLQEVRRLRELLAAREAQP